MASRRDPHEWARKLGVSREAAELIAASDCVDLHHEGFIWTRIFGYDLARRHGPGILGGRLFSQLDVPRLLESGLTGSVWSIATNPMRRRETRTDVLARNVARMRGIIESHRDLAFTRDLGGYEQARAEGRHACWIAVQGANALARVEDVERIAGAVSRITLVHMSDSNVGCASNPAAGLRGRRGLTDLGRELVRAMNTSGILVDLAHISERGFRDALEVHDGSLPAIVSHTGVRGVHDSWRNLSDRQIRSIADTGGVIGIMAHAWALASPFARVDASTIVDHMEHVIRVAGDEYVALGNDFDGFILTPHDMRTVDRLPVLVQRMLDRGFGTERIGRILGGNALRVMGSLSYPPTS
jgi:membrane dipeptidase